MKNIMIFGTGSGLLKAKELLDLQKLNIVSYIDNNPIKQGKLIENIKVISPTDINQFSYDYIVIASSYTKEIKEQLLSMGIKEQHIVELYTSKQKNAQQLVQEVYQHNLKYIDVLKEKKLYWYFKDYGISSMRVLPNRNHLLYKFRDYLLNGLDYVRISTLELLAREIYENQVEGAIAELGVYKGDFAVAIEQLFPDKKVYLFDTFEGFVKEDIQIEKEYGLAKANIGHLGDTSEQIVLDKLQNPSRFIVRKGYFPATAENLEQETFAFVHLDVDLYQPILEGLKYFYPRISKGGYILIHDYHHNSYTGVKKAVREFCEEHHISYTPVSDFFGSVIIGKK